LSYQAHTQNMNTMLLTRSKETRQCEIRCCCFCACIDETVKYKQTTCENMLNFLENNIIPTPYLFTYLTEHSKRLLQALNDVDQDDAEYDAENDAGNDSENDTDNDGSNDLFTLCVNCDSWIRRQTNKEKSYLHADAIFLNILFPGRFELPEERSCLGVVNNACLCNDGFNFLQSIAPVAAQEFFAVFSEKCLLPHKHDVSDAIDENVEMKTRQAKIEHWHILSPDSIGSKTTTHKTTSSKTTSSKTTSSKNASSKTTSSKTTSSKTTSSQTTTHKHRRQERRSHIKNKLVYIWWQRNRRCEFLSNKYTAKLLRHIIHGMP
jgi:hypothetical protein